MEKWGLGYDTLRSIRDDIIFVQQSGMGRAGTYGRVRTVGPLAAALAGSSEMSGLPEPAMPAGWGYSYLDWIGAYSFATAMVAALYHRDRTGEGQWIDASQVETGIFLAGVPILDWSANGRRWTRAGNRSPYDGAAPHGAYRCAGDDRWVAIAVSTDEEWMAMCAVANQGWEADERLTTAASRADHRDALDHAVEAWTSTQDAYDVMEALQRAGVAAGCARRRRTVATATRSWQRSAGSPR
jgi:crotonobetainyl-CoA:carnitine CoA-transferase CaiB-like acyl-CoA transferase